MKQILPSDWLPEWVRWAYVALLGLPALFLCLKKSCVVRTSIPVVCNFWLVWAMELQKGAEDSQNKEKVNDCHEVIILRKPKNIKLKNKMKISKSFLILIKVEPHSFFFVFFVLLDLDLILVHKNAKTGLGQYPAILISCLVNNEYFIHIFVAFWTSYTHFIYLV